MIHAVVDPNNWVRDYRSILFVMFVSQLFKVFRFAVRSVENLIEQWNQKLRHFLRDGSKYIVKNRAVSCSVFCVGIRQRSCHNVSVPHVVSYLSFSIYHKHLFLQYGKYEKQLLWPVLWSCDSNSDLRAKCSPWLLCTTFPAVPVWHQIWNYMCLLEIE